MHGDVNGLRPFLSGVSTKRALPRGDPNGEELGIEQKRLVTSQKNQIDKIDNGSIVSLE